MADDARSVYDELTDEQIKFKEKYATLRKLIHYAKGEGFELTKGELVTGKQETFLRSLEGQVVVEAWSNKYGILLAGLAWSDAFPRNITPNAIEQADTLLEELRKLLPS